MLIFCSVILNVFGIVAILFDQTDFLGKECVDSETSTAQIQEHVERIISPELARQGWIALFDGHSLFGWRVESSANWQVKDGQLFATSGQPGLIRTASQFSNFNLYLEYVCAENAEADLFLRTSPRPADDMSNGYRVKLKADDSGEVQKMNVACVGDQFTVHVNGQLVQQFADAKLGRGYVGLKFSSGTVRFRQVRLQPVSLQPIFQKDQTDSWTSHGNITVDFQDQAMVIKGGPGYIESTSSYANFVWQGQCWISSGGNSGVFYRCIPGENTNGYESQIDNSVTGTDKPGNCGTGGIFRRKDARRIVAQDEVWLTKTIVAEGPHVAVWVDGYQVTDWTDQRKADPNPRRGRRLDGGTLMLQGHDDQTTVKFKDVKVVELDPRHR